ncbi:MAG TPA: hypothetical protein VM347_27700 [Nonomuraea sp.]|nr:hypothetical protein [Nonomuraea sp.]
MTWLLIGGGAVAALNGLAGAYAVLSLTSHGGTLPLTPAAVYAGARARPAAEPAPAAHLAVLP